MTYILKEESDEQILGATAWALGQIGRHSPEHAKEVATANALPRLLELFNETSNSEELKLKVTLLLIIINLLVICIINYFVTS